MRNTYVDLKVGVFCHKLGCEIHSKDGGVGSGICSCGDEFINMRERVLVLDSVPLPGGDEYYVAMGPKGITSFYLPPDGQEMYLSVVHGSLNVNRAAA